jgi:phospholipase/carboxylesterase
VKPLRAVVSPGWPGVGTPVALLLHGLGSDEHDLPSLAPWLPPGLAWASLRAPLDFDFGGATWFPLELPTASEPVPRDPERAGIDAATDAIWGWVDARAPANAPVVPVGFSQGGLMALQLLRTRPNRVAATVVLSGLVADAPHPADSTLAETRPPVFWGRGTADAVIWAEAIERTSAWLPGHSTLTERVYPGLGHGVGESELADVRAFLDEHLAPRVPEPRLEA